jgi:hypothetical protein
MSDGCTTGNFACALRANVIGMKVALAVAVDVDVAVAAATQLWYQPCNLVGRATSMGNVVSGDGACVDGFGGKQQTPAPPPHGENLTAYRCIPVALALALALLSSGFTIQLSINMHTLRASQSRIQLSAYTHTHTHTHFFWG